MRQSSYTPVNMWFDEALAELFRIEMESIPNNLNITVNIFMSPSNHVLNLTQHRWLELRIIQPQSFFNFQGPQQPLNNRHMHIRCNELELELFQAEQYQKINFHGPQQPLNKTHAH